MKYFQICKRDLWGDYGNILLQGELTTAREGQTIVSANFSGCYPLEPAIFPDGNLVVNQVLKEQIGAAFPDVHFLKVFIDRLVDIDWRNFRVGNPRYPKGGEPENYLKQGTPIDIDANYFLVVPTEVAEVYQDWPDGVWDARFLAVLNYRLKVTSTNSPFLAGVLPNGNQVSTYISSEVLKCVLHFHWGQAIRFVEAN
jgi:hypothetical protein